MPLMKRKFFRVGQVNRSKRHPLCNGQILSATPVHDQVLPTMPGNDQALSTMFSKCQKLLIIAPQKRPCQKLDGTGENDSANTEKSLLTVAMQFSTHSFDIHVCMYVYIGFKTFFYIVQHLDSIASYLPTDFHLGFFRLWPSLFLPSNFSSVFLVLSFVLVSTLMLFWAIFLLSFFQHGPTM